MGREDAPVEPAAVARRRLLVVDDDPVARDFVAVAMGFHDFDVHEAPDSGVAMDLIRTTAFDVVILDVDLPTCSGITLMGKIREVRDVPILMLTSHDDSALAVIALEAGADEMCTKPIVERALALRVEMAIERHGVDVTAVQQRSPDDSPRPTSQVIISAGALTIDPYCRVVILDDQEVHLTAKEFDLLALFASSTGRPFTRVELLDAVWNAKPEWQSLDTVTEHIYRLRQKLDGPNGRSWIQTVRGAGYRLDQRRVAESELLAADAG